ncbi:hypothetical protein DHEL01_v202754 [Diaporthe helianthi]|uniref:Uncharacterized protein n=1 Tax=Diaporthe helianthi TaxID=158607 RepID=A0A2P5I8K9_DIAHE|nr:hypothetical protein DHEL01_v202754 [Diaporthe helianthi]
MDIDQALEAPPHIPECFRLLDLPSEIRLEIFEWAFKGSTVHAVLRAGRGAGGQPYFVHFRHSEHFRLLLTCRSIYKCEEAQKTYWLETMYAMALLGEFQKLVTCQMSDEKYPPQADTSPSNVIMKAALKATLIDTAAFSSVGARIRGCENRRT